MIEIAEIIVSIILIVLILLQERSSGLSGVFGGGGGDSSYQTRRGLEKSIYYGTIVFGIIFAALAITNLLVA
ncbi:MAG: Preprotein translocase, SecG subunit [Candidatus Jorgensenbacteria bacterium GW2011_GWA2_45_13]|uniref:Protein-export membrane protein SecG n=1 Tax=Candidatus Jorgensenbacteria bacterium GW2011_GWA2_45_13 TaxID=1618662 RepID=A0A0G1NCI6_9BACT|nr:MAG: Preprotein translocase, SecG subunit [Candidatus Jorgensenbacteria bacterium GW2011_GWA2_45_13]